MNDFLVKVAEVLDVAEVTPQTEFRHTEGWCSLLAFGLIVLLHEDYGVSLDVMDLQAFTTVDDLARAAGINC